MESASTVTLPLDLYVWPGAKSSRKRWVMRAFYAQALGPRPLPASAGAEDGESVDAALHAHLAVGVAFAEAIAQALQLGRDLLRDRVFDDVLFMIRCRRAVQQVELLGAIQRKQHW